MGHRLSASEEVQLLRQATREAHEAAKDLRAAIREANALAPTLVAKFEQIHTDEIRQLSNHLTEESNRHAAGINADIQRAKEMIFDEIMAGELVLDPERNVVMLRLGGLQFDEHQPPPYPNHPPKESNQ